MQNFVEIFIFKFFQTTGSCSNSRGDKLEAGAILGSDQYLTDPNCVYSLWLHDNGNLILYKGLTTGRQNLWASQTSGEGTAPYRLSMLAADNHLVLTDKNGDTIWSTNVYGDKWKTGAYLALQEDGNLVVYDGDRDAMWDSGTNGGKKSSKYGTGITHEKGKIYQTLNYFRLF